MHIEILIHFHTLKQWNGKRSNNFFICSRSSAWMECICISERENWIQMKGKQIVHLWPQLHVFKHDVRLSRKETELRSVEHEGDRYSF